MNLEGSVRALGNPARWQLTALGSFLSQSKRTSNGALPILGVDLRQGVRKRSDGDGRPAPSEDLSNYKLVRMGDVVMNRLGKPHGSVGVSDFEGITSPAYWVLHVNNEVAHPRFVHFLLRSAHMIAEYNRLGKHMPPNQFDLSWENFRSIVVPMPSIVDQWRIANFLDAETSRLDQLSRLRLTQLPLLTERGQREKLSQIEGYEPTWLELRRAGARVTTGPFGTALSAAEYVHGAVPVINPTHIKDSRINPSLSETVPPEVAIRLRRHMLRAGDMVVGRKGDIGRSALVNSDQDGWICGSDSIAIHFDQSRLSLHT